MKKTGKAKLTVILIGCILLVVLVPGVIVLMNRPGLRTATLPSPNGFETLQRAGHTVTGLPDDYSETEDVEKLKTFVETNHEAGALIDQAVDQQFVVPIDYQRGFAQATESISPVRQAMRYLIAKARVAELEQDEEKAALLYAKLFSVASMTTHEGLLVHVQAAAAYERLGLGKLKEISPQLTTQQKEDVLSIIVATNRQPRDLDAVVKREHTLSKIEHGTLRATAMIWLSGHLSTPVIDRTRAVDAEVMTLYNQLQQELAE